MCCGICTGTMGLTMLVSSHNLGVIRRIADATVVMYLGQIVEQGATAEVFARPAHPYTAALLSAHPAIDPARRRSRIVLSGEIPSVIDPPLRVPFPHTMPKRAGPLQFEYTCTTAFSRRNSALSLSPRLLGLLLRHLFTFPGDNRADYECKFRTYSW